MTTEHDAIAPHGGVLVDRVASPERAAELKARAPSLPRLELHVREIADLDMIAVGALSPMDGFMTRTDYARVVAEGRLANGLPWTSPITLSATRDRAALLQPGKQAALYYENTLHAVIDVAEIFERDPREAKN